MTINDSLVGIYLSTIVYGTITSLGISRGCH